MKCPRCLDTELAEGPERAGPLSSSPCGRCGGGFMPEDGCARLLEELGHTTAELRELASMYAGARIACPGCKSKMSPLPLRGVYVDICFGCGSLWLDKGDLEQVSGGRWQMPPPTAPPAVTRQALEPAQSLVRVDERTLPRHVGRAVLAGVGAVGVVWTLVGILPALTGLASAVALACAAGLSRREAFDVLPRARRMMRWRGWFAPSAKDDVGEPFSPDSCVVVRRPRVPARVAGSGGSAVGGGRPLPWVALDLVDAEGRDLVRLHGAMSLPRAWTEAPRYARALGVSVRFDVEPSSDDALDQEQLAQQREPTPASPVVPLLGADVVKIDPDHARGPRRLWLKASDGVVLGSAVAETVPRGRPHDLDGVLAEHFALEDGMTGRKVRLYSTWQLDERATILVGDDGAVLGHVSATRGFLADTFEWRGPQGRRSLKARVAHASPSARLVDGYGRDVGALDLSQGTPQDPRPVAVRIEPSRLTGAARWGVVALALHVSLAALTDELL